MIGLDCNILVQLAVAEHLAHQKSVAAVHAETEKLVIADLVATEFLHTVTDPRRFDPPFTMAEAIQWLSNFLTNPSVELVHAGDATLRQTMLWMQQYKLGRKRILDTHLAAILLGNGVTRLMTSNQSDFAVFTDLEIVSP